MSRPRATQLIGVLSVLALTTLATPGAAHGARCPSLTIVLERSGSMLLDLAGRAATSDPAKQRWSVAKAAILRAVAAYNSRMPLGVTLYPSDNLCGSGEKLRVAPAYDTQLAITTALAESDSFPDGGGMPTCGAIRRTAKALAAETRDSYLLLVTDGLPSCDGTCSIDTQDPAASAVTAISEAASTSHPVKTFVLGIGTLSQQARNGLTRMAAAGGVPDRNNPTLKFFSASDVVTLDAALERIMDSLITDETGATCDESCVPGSCSDPGQVCLHGRCAADPCQALSCRAGEYCYSTGTAAKCVAPCDKPCAAGSHCSLGSCIHDGCRETCAAGSRCDTTPTSAQAGTCIPDPACAALRCTATQACIAGSCHEDPCAFTRCPDGLSCVPFDGSCVSTAFHTDPLSAPEQLAVGCTLGNPTSQPGALPTAAVFSLLALALLSRRRRTA